MQTDLRWTWVGTVFACCFAGCSESREQPTTDDAKPAGGIVDVYVVNYPLKYLSKTRGQLYFFFLLLAVFT
ncbi:MAG: hypothetical protein ACC628_09945 [Pirellulaceae bacterium]